MTQTKTNYRRLYVFGLVINSALGYACLGYNFSIFNTLQNFLQSHVLPDASTSEVSLIASSLSCGAIVGSLLASPILARFGRRTIMLGVDVLGVIGLVLTIIPSLLSILIGRFIAGIVAGINTVVVPIYLVEMSPLSMCGASGSLSIIIMELFNFVSLALGYAVPSEPGEEGITNHIWRVLFAAPAVLHIIRFILLTLVFKYETPFLYIQRKQDDKAHLALKKIFTSEVETEFSRVNTDVQASSSQGSEGIKDLFSSKYRKSLLICFLIAVVQQFCGLPAIFAYSNDIFSRSTDNTDLYSTLLGVTNISSVIVSFFFIEKLGRKILIVAGTALLGVLTLAFGIITQNDHDSPILKFLLIVWPIFFQLSLGPLTFLYISEALPPIGVSLCIAANWISAFLICQFYLETSNHLGSATPFIFFGAFSLFCAFIFWYMLVETKGRTKSEIIDAYMGTNSAESSKIEKDIQSTLASLGLKKIDSIGTTIQIYLAEGQEPAAPRN